MKKLIALVACGALGLAAYAQPYNARGEFNGWGESAMNDDGDGSYSLTITGYSAGVLHEFKIATNGWASNWPGSNCKSAYDGNGDFTFHFYPGAIADGWNPPQDRVGYSDPAAFGWEITGAFNGWNDAVDTAARQMTNLGGGLYSVDYTIATPGTYAFKFRKSGSWDVSIGQDFGNSAANCSTTTTAANQTVKFELDLPNGRWRTNAVTPPDGIDGVNIPGKFGGNALVVSQCNQTNAGNNVNEMNRMFIENDADTLYLGVTGNQEQDGNCWLFFLDTKVDAGQFTLKTDPGFDDGPPYALEGMHNSSFDPCFRPDYVLVVNTFGGNVYGNLYILTDGVVPTNGNGRKIYLGQQTVGSGSGTLSGGDPNYNTRIGFTNDNTLGVNGSGDPVGDPATALNGMEAQIPLVDIGSPGTDATIKVFALLVDNADGLFWNQALPCIPDGNYGPNPQVISGDPDSRVGFDFGAAPFSGTQFASYTLTQANTCNPCDTNCDGSVNPFDINDFLVVVGGGSGCSPCAGDTNADGTTNPFDINGFLVCLQGYCE